VRLLPATHRFRHRVDAKDVVFLDRLTGGDVLQAKRAAVDDFPTALEQGHDAGQAIVFDEVRHARGYALQTFGGHACIFWTDDVHGFGVIL
jgi:hypothetical protein